MNLDPAMDEVPKKFYIGYKISQYIVVMNVRTQKIRLYLKLNPKQITNLPGNSRDVSGHFGGDLELTVASPSDLPIAKELINLAYQKIGG